MKIDSPFFSIIIPTYNRANLIAKTLDSILNQSFKDFEVIIVDDVLATGGTLSAGITLVGLTGAQILGSVVLGEIPFLDGRKKIALDHPGHRIDAIFEF